MGGVYGNNANSRAFGQARSGLFITPRMSVSEIYTDNVDLQPAGQADSDLLTRLRPGFDVYANGARVNANLSYSLDAVLSSFGSGRNNLFHDLDAIANAELIKQHLFIDARARSTQQAINLLGPIGIDNTTATNNLTEVTAVSVSPYLTNHFGSFADSTLRYAHERVFDNRGGGYSNQASAQLASGNLFGPLFWVLAASHEHTELSGDFEAGTFNQAFGQLGYRLNPHWSVFATGGYEDNQFESFRNTQDGAFWDVGVHWVPNQRTDVEAHYGHRFFGSTSSLSLSYRRRTTLWQASYSESIASKRNLVLTNAGTVSVLIPPNVGSGLTPFCSPSDPNCTEVSLFTPQSVNDFFLMRQAVASVTAFSPRHSVTLAYSLLRQTFESDGAQARQQGVTLGWSWRLTADSRFNAASGWTQNEPERSNRHDDFWNVQVGVSHDLSSDAVASLNYRHQARLSNASSAEYDENGVIADFSIRF